MAIHVCFRCMFQMFHLFQTNVAGVLSGCCKSRSWCYIYMHIASICFKCFEVFHMYVCKCFIWMLHVFAMILKCFSVTFASVSDAFKCFIYLFLYVATVVFWCFKNRSGVAHEMHVGRGRRCGRRPGQRGRRSGRRGTTTNALPHEPDALDARSLPVQAASRC
jgi:hypothetical protein